MAPEKKRIIAAVGLSLFIVCVPLVVFAQGIVPCGDTANGQPPCDFEQLIILVNRIIDFLLVKIAFPISAAFFAWAGFLYLTAAGDEGKVKKAHGIFQNVFWGLILALAAWLIIDLVTSTLTGVGWAKNPFTTH